jgi:hypothetical protein
MNKNTLDKKTKKKPSKTWFPTTPEEQLSPLVPDGASLTWFVDKQTLFLWGARTHNVKQSSFHIQLFRTKKEREQYYDGTDSHWDKDTRFFRFKNRIKIDKHGKWWIHKAT